MMDFSGSAGAVSDFDILPKGFLCWAILSVRGVKASGSGGQYVDCELTVDQGQPYAGRKFWEMIGDPFHQGNSEKYRQMGQIAITRILEAGKGAGPNNPAGYQLSDYSQLNGLRVAVKVGVEAGSDGHDDKNRVAEWLTPNPASQSGYKGFAKLQAKDHGLTQGSAPSAANGAGFGGATANATPAGNGSGFGNGGNANAGAATSGFGNTQPGFQQPAADSSGQSSAQNNAGFAEGQQTTSGFAQTGGAVGQSPSNQPGQTPGWLEQAAPQA